MPANQTSGGAAASPPGRWRIRGDRLRLVLCLAPVVILFVGVYGSAIVRMLLLSVGAPDWSMREYVDLAGDPVLWDVLSYTLGLAGGVTIICFALGYPVALVMLHASPRMQRLLTLLLVLPLWTSTLVRSYAWMVLLGRRGVINDILRTSGLISDPLPLLYNRAAVYVGMVHIMLPYMVFPIYSVMKQIDLRLVTAARSLGAGKTTAMLSIIVPLSFPGVTVGCILTFVIALGFWVTPALLGGISDTTYVMMIETQVNRLANWPLSAAMSLLLLVVTLLILVFFQRILGIQLTGAGVGARQQRSTHLLYICARWLVRGQLVAKSLWHTIRGSPIPAIRLSRRRQRPLDAPTRTPIGWIITAAVIAFLLFPIVILVPLSFSGSPFMEFPPKGYSLQWYERYFAGSDWIDPTTVSFEVAIATMLLATVIGTLAALALVKGRFRFRGALLAFVLSAHIVPTIVTAVALYFEFAPLRLVGTVHGLILAHLIICIPLVIVVVMGIMQNFDYSLERAARSLGAGPLRTFRSVVLPLIWPGIVTAAFFAFLASFDEVMVAVFLSGTRAATLPKRLLDATRGEFEPTVAAVSVLLIMVSIIVILIVDIAQQRLSRQKAQRRTSSNERP